VCARSPALGLASTSRHHRSFMKLRQRRRRQAVACDAQVAVLDGIALCRVPVLAVAAP
jgi:hypothetical protein